MTSALSSHYPKINAYRENEYAHTCTWDHFVNPYMQLAEKHESSWDCSILSITKDAQTSKVKIMLEHFGSLGTEIKLHLDPLLLDKSPEARFILIQALKDPTDQRTSVGGPTAKVYLEIDLSDEKYKQFGLSFDTLLFIDSSQYDSMLLRKIKGQEPSKDSQGDNKITTLAIGEESQDSGRPVPRSENRLTTKMVGEEGQDGGRQFPRHNCNPITTMMVGEESQDSGRPWPCPEHGITTLAIGEEGQDAWQSHLNLTTKMVGEEGQY